MTLISRLVDDEIQIFDPDLEPVRSIRTPSGTRGYALSRSGDRVVYAVGDEVVCEGAWRFALGRSGPAAEMNYTGVAFSADDTVLWVYAPDARADRGDRRDRWIALDAATGAVRAVHRLDTAGHGGPMIAHPDGHMLLDVGEGREGSRTFRVRLGEPPFAYPWRDRVLIDLSPSGRQLMTVDHRQLDVAFHGYESGTVQLRVSIGTLEDDPGDAGFEWTGGYVDEDTVVAVVAGVEGDEDEDEWWRNTLVDVRTGAMRPLPVLTADPYELQPLGDGTYLTTDTDGTLRRHRL